MAAFETKHFGNISFDPQAIIEFPRGLPGFEERRKFLALEFEHSKPLVFLQSLEDPGICFVTAPVRAVEPEYVLRVSEEDLRLLGLDPARQPRIGPDVLCLSVVSIEESGTTANLLAPIVVNVRNLQAVQAIGPESVYSHRFPLVVEEATVCS